MKFHSPPILRVQSCLTDAVIVILSDYCFTDTHLMRGRAFPRAGHGLTTGPAVL